MNRFEIDRLLTTCRGYIQGAIKSYSNCMTQGEIEQWLYTNFLKIVESQENLIDAFIELKEWVVNEGMKNAIVEQLQEWLIDGTLSNIINDELFGEINEKIEVNKNNIQVNKNDIVSLNNDFEKVQLKSNSKIHFIKSTGTADCIIIQTENNKNIMIDSGIAEEVTQTKQELAKLGISKIDYFILSHYDYDHMGGLALLDNIDFSSCEFFLPQIPIQSKVTENVWIQYQQVMTFVSDKNFKRPIENEILTVGNDTIKFVNTNHTNYYSATPFEYNDCCLCCVYQTQKTKTLFTGDIHIKAQKYLSDNKLLEKMDILKLNHHGYDGSVYLDYLKYCYPKMCFVTNGTGDAGNGYNAFNRGCTSARYLDSQGIPIFTTAENGTMTVEIENGIFRTKAKTTKISNGLKTYNSYREIFNDTDLSRDTTNAKMRDILDKMESNSMAWLNLTDNEVAGEFFGNYLGDTSKSVLILKSASNKYTDQYMYSSDINYYRATILCFGTALSLEVSGVLRTNVYVNPSNEPQYRVIAKHFPIKDNATFFSYCTPKENDDFIYVNGNGTHFGRIFEVSEDKKSMICKRSGYYKLTPSSLVTLKSSISPYSDMVQILKNGVSLCKLFCYLPNTFPVLTCFNVVTFINEGDVITIKGTDKLKSVTNSVELLFEYIARNSNFSNDGDMTPR